MNIRSSEIFGTMWNTLSTMVMFLMILSITECTGLRLTNMTAPVIQDPREDMQFYCEFDMGGEELYAVKWYKDDHEFFRYSPSRVPNLMKFIVRGVHVDSRRSGCEQSSCTLLLNNLSKNESAGAYRCEVSTEAPTFRLISDTRNVTIAVLPKENPKIEGLAGSYQIGDFLNASCTSGLGDPKPVVTWYISQEPVDSKYTRELPQHDVAIQEEAGMKLRKSSVQLRFPLDREVTKNKLTTSIEVACVQTAADLNASIVPSRVTKKTILVSTEDHLVRNQFFFSSGVLRTGKTDFLIFLLVILMNF